MVGRYCNRPPGRPVLAARQPVRPPAVRLPWQPGTWDDFEQGTSGVGIDAINGMLRRWPAGILSAPPLKASSMSAVQPWKLTRDKYEETPFRLDEQRLFQYICSINVCECYQGRWANVPHGDSVQARYCFRLMQHCTEDGMNIPLPFNSNTTTSPFPPDLRMFIPRLLWERYALLFTIHSTSRSLPFKPPIRTPSLTHRSLK